MTRMLLLDFISLKSFLVQQLIMCLCMTAFLFIAVEGGVFTAVGIFAAMFPMLYMYSVAAYDELNGWERLRLALPLTRRQVVLGRYASVLVVAALGVLMGLLLALVLYALSAATASLQLPEMLQRRLMGLGEGGDLLLDALSTALMSASCILLLCAVTLPLIMKCGCTKGTRILPMIMVFGGVGTVLAVQNTSLAQKLEPVIGLLSSEGSSFFLVVACAAGVALALYAISALLSVKLYESRGF